MPAYAGNRSNCESNYSLKCYCVISLCGIVLDIVYEDVRVIDGG